MINKWKTTPESISKQSFYDLFNNIIPYISIDNFLTQKECDTLLHEIQKMGLQGYDYNFNTSEAPPAQHLFETHYLYENKSPEEYFEKAAQSIESYQKFCDDVKMSPDKKVFQYMEKMVNAPVTIATQNGKFYSTAIIRELKNSAMLHADFAAFIPSYWVISEVVAQYAWNIYLTDPGEGGECVVYNKPWEKEDDKYIVGDTYGYDNQVVAKKECVEIPVHAGRLTFFNSRNFHEVNASKNLRVSIGGHIGLTKSGQIIAWI